MVGQEFRGTVEDLGREGDGIVKVDGKVVFVKGAAMGEHVVFRVTEDAGRFARGEVVSKSETPFATAPSATPIAKPASDDHGDIPVAVGDELDVEVVEGDRRNPSVDGVARIDRFVVFVPGTQPGDRARIRITDVRSRAAQAEVIERLPATP
ncbi:MAG TPA: TRAM domain-containing protein [Kiritimatiellia bacterium]|nr:TRAM domain-containing protein [Kiritimatiellia bacterium]HMP33886.1 TRAM domain-containing protein [Kiritimatiellia bacterium]